VHVENKRIDRKATKLMEYNGGFKKIINTDGRDIPFKVFKFPGGEVHVKIESQLRSSYRITASILSSDDLMFVLLAVDALKRMAAEHIQLFIPYVPYARQDRVMVDGEPFSLKVFAKLINSLEIDVVGFYDAHSEVTPALINNSYNIENWYQVDEFIFKEGLPRGLTVISPDAGAYKKIHKTCQKISKYHPDFIKEILVANKIRDVRNGEILGCEVFGDVKGKDCLIIDDICDGGWTFTELGSVLKDKDCGNLFLFVSHGIFSKGLDELTKYYDLIGTTNSYRDDIVNDKLKYFDVRVLGQ
jgi:ribose-phosphate pyrophosphokinase